MTNNTNVIIEEMSENIKNYIENAKSSQAKLNQIEDKVHKMQNYFSRPDTAIGDYKANATNILANDHPSESEEQRHAFNNFIRHGVQNDLITKSLSGNDNEGDVLLTPTLSKHIISQINSKSPMRQIAAVESISTRALDIITENGLLTSGWIGETEARDVTDTAPLIKKTIHTHELYTQPKATQNILDDSEINMNSWLVGRIADSFVRLENAAFINGDGDKKPFGLLRNTEISTTRANTINANSLLQLMNQLEEGYLTNACFLMNRNTLSMIQGLTDYQGRFIWQQSLSENLKQTIFGIPVVISSNMPNIESNNIAIALGDFKSAYKIVDRSGINLMRDPYTDKPFVRFYAVKRVGGDVINPNAVKFINFTQSSSKATLPEKKDRI